MIVGLSGKLLPIHPQPKPDEIFSSWYCRVAKANSMKLHTLEVKLWGREKQIWTRDVDRSIDDATLERFASVCGTPIERARETCLGSYEGIVFRELNRRGHSNWILPAGVYHRKRVRSGMQFCPYCLATDSEPYFRKSWRLAFSTICERHGTMLHDCCPECQAPVSFHRHEMGERLSTQVGAWTHCSHCGFDLSRAVAYDAPVAEIHAFLALRHQLSFFDWGWTFADEETFQYSHLYFDALRNLLRKLRSSLTTCRLREAAELELGIEVQWLSPPKTSFEFYGVMERHCLLQIAVWLLMDWPGRFLRVAREAKVRHSELVREFEGVPFWFGNGVAPLGVDPIGPCPEEREAMRALLSRAVDDQIKLDRLKRHVVVRMANRPVRELWHGDRLAFPDDVNYGAFHLPGIKARELRRKSRSAADLGEAVGDSSTIGVVATTSAKRNGVYGLRVEASSPGVLLQWFPREWPDVELELSGQVYVARFRAGFWETTRELRCRELKAWLETKGLSAWPRNQPPRFKLVKLEGRRFRLLE
jgi:hypothetical protein